MRGTVQCSAAQRRQVHAEFDGLCAWSFTSTLAADNGGRHEFTTMWVATKAACMPCAAQPACHEAQPHLPLAPLAAPAWAVPPTPLLELNMHSHTQPDWAGLPQPRRHRPVPTRTARLQLSVLMLPSLSVQGCCRQGACLLPNDQHQGLPVHGAPNWPCGVLCTNGAASGWPQPQLATSRFGWTAAIATPAHEVSPFTACEPQLPFRLASPLPTGGPHVVGAALRGHQLPGLRHW